MDLQIGYARSVQGWVDAVNGIDGGWDGPTPCTDWDVRALVNHVVGEDLWTKPLVDGLTIADVGDRLDGDLLGDDPVAAAQAAAQQASAATAERLPQGRPVQLSYGEESVEEYIRQLFADHLIHSWDLLAATGQDRTLDADLVSEVAAWFAGREEMYRAAGAVAGRTSGIDESDPQHRLLSAFGRDPGWQPPA